jgi:hypothetical protein
MMMRATIDGPSPQRKNPLSTITCKVQPERTPWIETIELELLEPSSLIEPQLAVLLAPAIVGLFRETELAAALGRALPLGQLD